jgi:hypothetical protein
MDGWPGFWSIRGNEPHEQLCYDEDDGLGS